MIKEKINDWETRRGLFSDLNSLWNFNDDHHGKSIYSQSSLCSTIFVHVESNGSNGIMIDRWIYVKTYLEMKSSSSTKLLTVVIRNSTGWRDKNIWIHYFVLEPNSRRFWSFSLSKKRYFHLIFFLSFPFLVSRTIKIFGFSFDEIVRDSRMSRCWTTMTKFIRMDVSFNMTTM